MVLLPMTLGDLWNHLYFYILLCLMRLRDCKYFKFAAQVNVRVTAYGWQTVPDRGMVRSCDITKFWGLQSYHWDGWTKVVKFCTHVGYTNSSNRMTYHPQKWSGYGYVTVLKLCYLLWCSASRRFASDSWATCIATQKDKNLSNPLL